MDAKARRDSVDGAFALLTPQIIEGESILLIDDVFTTGSTVSACSRLLMDRGAAQVLVLTLARPLTRDYFAEVEALLAGRATAPLRVNP